MIRRKKLFRLAFGLLVLIGIFDLGADFLYLHWMYWWYDVGLHFFGGVCVSLAMLSVFPKNWSKEGKVIALGTLAALIIGILWEIFEYSNGLMIAPYGPYYWMDTISDLIMDTSGGFFATLFSLKFFKNG